MTKKKENKTSKNKSVEEFLKEYPKPPPEHTYELKMEKQLRRMIKKRERLSSSKYMNLGLGLEFNNPHFPSAICLVTDSTLFSQSFGFL